MTVAAPPVAVSGEGAPGRRSLTARRIAELVGGELLGSGATEVVRVAPVDRATADCVTFLGSARYAAAAAASAAGVVLVSQALREAALQAPARIVVEQPHEAVLALLPLLYDAPTRHAGVDATARLGSGVSIGRGVEIGPYAVLGRGVELGERVVIGAHTVVGDGVRIGQDVQLKPHVTVYSGTEIGDRCIVHSGARLGSDGFGYVPSRTEHRKIPHVGRCILESDIEVGANTTIDRGSIDDTVIGAGTKIDNLVQIAHNVRIGKMCLIMAQVGIAGSVRIGDGCVLAGQVGVSGHHEIGSGAKLAAQAGVFGDVPAGETWSGYPARPHRDALRSHAALFKLSGMIRRLEKLLDGTKES